MKGKCSGGVSAERFIAALGGIVMLSAAAVILSAAKDISSLFCCHRRRTEYLFDSVDYFFAGCSNASAISSNFRTVFQFLPVEEIFSVRSTVAMDNFGRAMPFGK